MDELYCGNSADVLKEFPYDSFDLTVTSPPYDNLRSYNEYEFDFDEIAKQLYRTTKDGGVVVWVVGDATVRGSETGSSFRQALKFMELGFNLHDTMIYEKNGSAFPSPKNGVRYTQIFEYSFVFVKPEKSSCSVLRLDSRLSNIDCAWLASAIDGEGCFRIRYNGKGGSIASNINVSNTNYDYVKRCQDITGLGTIYEHSKYRFYEWNVASDDAAKISAEIYPYLIIKKERAKVIIEAQRVLRKESKPGRSSPLTEKEKSERKKFFDILKGLNSGELTNSGLPEPKLEIKTSGGPKTHNLIIDKPNRWAGFTNFGKPSHYLKDGTKVISEKKNKPTPDFSARNNIWRYNNGFGYSTKDKVKHPAIFPEDLAKDHILTWSNPGDVVLDPFSGSGTTVKMAKLLDRHYVGIDISKEYIDMTISRLEGVK